MTALVWKRGSRGAYPVLVEGQPTDTDRGGAIAVRPIEAADLAAVENRRAAELEYNGRAPSRLDLVVALYPCPEAS